MGLRTEVWLYHIFLSISYPLMDIWLTSSGFSVALRIYNTNMLYTNHTIYDIIFVEVK